MNRFLFGAALGLAILAPAAFAAERPKYGGTLRVELHEMNVSLDPREWRTGSLEAAVNEKLAALVFDRLLALDNYGRFQPQLASEWSHDAVMKRWQFTLRQGVKFSDGSPLTATEVVTALQPLLPGTLQLVAAGNAVTIQSSAPAPDLLEQLASGRYFIYRVQPDGTLLGTGPFFVAESSASPAAERSSASESAAPSAGAAKVTHLHFRANQETWSGRAFLDAIDVTLGVPFLRQLFDLQLGKTDLVELSPDLVRRAAQENLRVWSSAPVTLFALRFDEAQSAVAEARLREAFALSLDRGTMAGVLLQKQAEPASALLPQWLSGYAFLFNTLMNLDRAKEIRVALPDNAAAGTEPLRLRVDAPGDLAKLLGERVAVNARQAGIRVQVASHSALRSSTAAAPGANDAAAGMHLFAWRYSSLSPRAELDALVAAQNLAESPENTAGSADPEQLYAREHRLLDNHRVLPLVALPEFVGLSPHLRDWMPARWGEWHLADVWLDPPDSPPAPSGYPPATVKPASSYTPAPVPGVHP